MVRFFIKLDLHFEYHQFHIRKLHIIKIYIPYNKQFKIPYNKKDSLLTYNI